MTGKMLNIVRKNGLLVWALVWVFVWVLPWATWLDPLPWIRLGIAIIVFATPGMMISLILVGERLTLPAHFTSGVALSVFVVGSLGMLGRIFNLPFDFIKSIFALMGLIALLVLFIYSRSKYPLYKPNSFSITTLVLLLSMIVFSTLTFFQYRIQGDVFSYLAYLTNWQHAQPLNFREVVFGSGNMDAIRFWLAMFPMNLALIAEISNLHGLLLVGLYLGPYMLVLALLAGYSLYEDLLGSEHQAIVALLLQFTVLFLLARGHSPGAAFFYRLSEDKAFAAFILAPVFFLAVRCFLVAYTPRAGALVLLSGLSLTVTHPIILAYSIFIAGLYAAIVTINGRNYRKFMVVTVLLVATMLPAIPLRFVGVPWVSRYVFGLSSVLQQPGRFTLESALRIDPGDRVSYIEGTPFYGFGTQILQIRTVKLSQENPLQVLLSWSYLWILGLGFLWSIFNLKKENAAPFIASASLLVLLSAIPYTGWLLGYFVSARMLWRTPWLLPIGLVGVVLFTGFVKFSMQKHSDRPWSKMFNERTMLGLISVACLLLIGYFSVSVYRDRWFAVTRIDNYKNRLERLSTLGDYLEDNVEKPSIFVAPNNLRDYIPGLSSKSKPVYFRGPNYTPHRVDLQKVNLIFSQDVPVTQQMNILKRYHVQYILVEESSLKDYYASYPQFFIQNVAGFWLIEFRETSG